MDAPTTHSARHRRLKHARRVAHQRHVRQLKMDALNVAVTNSRINKSNGQPNAADVRKGMTEQGYVLRRLGTGLPLDKPSSWVKAPK